MFGHQWPGQVDWNIVWAGVVGLEKGSVVKRCSCYHKSSQTGRKGVNKHHFFSLWSQLLPVPPIGLPNQKLVDYGAWVMQSVGEASVCGSEQEDNWQKGKWKLPQTAPPENFFKYLVRKILGKILSLMAKECLESFSLNIKQHLALNKKGTYFVPHI